MKTGASSGLPSVSIVIATLGREKVLVETLTLLLGLRHGAEELLVVDQSPSHERETTAALQAWHSQGRIRWIRREKPSIPAAMNDGLRQARSEVVLFVDDDVRPRGELVRAHAEVHGEGPRAAVNGQVLQPGETAFDGPTSAGLEGMQRDLDFRFNSTRAVDDIASLIGCNLSVRRAAALDVGGFDERFVGAAYRFETEFCRRLLRSGLATRFDPRPSIDHLRAGTGGTRHRGSHLTSASPAHAVGDYYFAHLEAMGMARWRYIARRMLREVATRFHARRPWWIPVKLVGEARGLLLARKLYREKLREARSAA